MAKSVAIVTGASQGIGRSTAIRLARGFSALALVARDRANLDETAEAEVDLRHRARDVEQRRRFRPNAARA